jgi:hypothetical protein
MLRRLIAIAVLALALAALAACAPKADTASTRPPVKAEKARPATVGPLPAGVWARAGRYEVRLDRAMVIAETETPGPEGPDHIYVDHLGKGQRMAAAWVSIRVPESSKAATLPAPLEMDVLLARSGIVSLWVDDEQSLLPASAGVLRQPGPAHVASLSATPGLNRYSQHSAAGPIQKGDTYTLLLGFVVSADAKSLVLVQALPGSKWPVVEYELKADEVGSLGKALKSAGVPVNGAERATGLFSGGVASRILHSAGGNVYFYEFASTDDADKIASRIGKDGSSIPSGGGTSEVEWKGAPHFYRRGSVVVLYLTQVATPTPTERPILTALEARYGPQFAGLTSR